MSTLQAAAADAAATRPQRTTPTPAHFGQQHEVEDLRRRYAPAPGQTVRQRQCQREELTRYREQLTRARLLRPQMDALTSELLAEHEQAPSAPDPWVVIACGGKKQPGTARRCARDLYTGAGFTLALDVATTLARPERVLILSAEHALLRLHDLVRPYERRMEPARVALIADRAHQQASRWGILPATPLLFLPKLYAAAAVQVWPGAVNAFTGSRGLLEQRARLASWRTPDALARIHRTAGLPDPAPDAHREDTGAPSARTEPTSTGGPDAAELHRRAQARRHDGEHGTPPPGQSRQQWRAVCARAARRLELRAAGVSAYDAWEQAGPFAPLTAEPDPDDLLF